MTQKEEDNKGLRPGMWCHIESDQDWTLIYRLSVLLRMPVLGNSEPHDRVWFAFRGSSGLSVGSGPGNSVDELKRVEMPRFLMAMLEQAEINKKIREEPMKVVSWQVDKDGNILPPATTDHEKRIKALEAEVGSLSDYHKLVGSLKGELASLKERVSKLEGPIDLRDCRLLTSYTTPITHGAVGPGYEMRIDPNASPVGLPFEIALLYAKSGRSIRRYGWLNNMMFVVDGLRFVDGFPDPLSMEDLSANDWLVVSEPQTP